MKTIIYYFTGTGNSLKVAKDLAGELGDNGTKEMLDSILQDEEGHIDAIEAQRDQIQQIGVQNFLEAQL